MKILLRALRADPKRKGLLYAGTERGMYISFNDGNNWEKFQLNLPIVPITDLAIKDDNLIAATQGRSFWMIDDLTPIHQLRNNTLKEKVTLFTPKASYQLVVEMEELPKHKEPIILVELRSILM